LGSGEMAKALEQTATLQLEQVQYHLDVGVEGVGRVQEGVVQRLGGAVEHHVDRMTCEDVLETGVQLGVVTIEGDLAGRQCISQVLLATDKKVVDHHHVSRAHSEKLVDQMAADEAGATGHQNCLARKPFSNRHACTAF